MDDFSALPVGGAQAVGAGVAAAEDDDPLALGGDPVGDAFAGQGAVLLGQVFHGEMHAVQFPPRHFQIPGLGGASSQTDGVVFLQQSFRRVVDAHIDAGLESDAFLFHQSDAPAHYRLFQLEVRYAQHQQAADVVGPFQDGYGVAGAVELLRRRQAGGAAADYRHPFAGAGFGRRGLDPALLKAPVADFLFNVFNGNRVGVDAQHAGGFAGRRADAAGEFGEVVGA